MGRHGARSKTKSDLALELTRIGVASAIPEVLQELGADARAVIEGAGLSSDVFSDPDNAIPFAALENIFLTCVAATGCEHFGLLVGQKGSATSLGLIGLLASNSPDVHTGLGHLERYFHINENRGVLSLNQAEGTATLGYSIFGASSPGALQIVDATMALGFRIMRGLCGGAWHAIEVSLPRARPKEVRPFLNAFEAPVHFGMGRGAMSFTEDWLAHRIRGANTLVRKLVEDRLGEIDIGAGERFDAQLRRFVRLSLLSHRCSLESVARLFNIDARVLARHCDREKIDFRSVVGEVRYEIARHLLADTSLSMTQVAAALDYSELSSFTRAFRRWSGTTPHGWRSDAHRERAILANRAKS